MTKAKETGVAWRSTASPISYPEALSFMDQRVDEILNGTAPELVWLLEHPPLYTAGTSARETDLLDPGYLPIYQTGRGGQYTYHGPGQRIAYVMLDLRRRGSDVRAYVCNLEAWLIAVLKDFGLNGVRRQGRVGVWLVKPDGGEDKIAALGVRVRRWVTFHGVSLNVAPDLAQYRGIVPCGVRQHGVTSMAEKGVTVTMADVDHALRRHFEAVFAS